jgi:hypothetical protein
MIYGTAAIATAVVNDLQLCACDQKNNYRMVERDSKRKDGLLTERKINVLSRYCHLHLTTNWPFTILNNTENKISIDYTVKFNQINSFLLISNLNVFFYSYWRLKKQISRVRKIVYVIVLINISIHSYYVFNANI